jgi:hypothetical protein
VVIDTGSLISAVKKSTGGGVIKFTILFNINPEIIVSGPDFMEALKGLAFFLGPDQAGRKKNGQPIFYNDLSVL